MTLTSFCCLSISWEKGGMTSIAGFDKIHKRPLKNLLSLNIFRFPIVL